MEWVFLNLAYASATPTKTISEVIFTDPTAALFAIGIFLSAMTAVALCKKLSKKNKK